MSEALWGFLGVIIGAAVSLLGEQFTTRREREARQAVREQTRKDTHDAFQRDAIIVLQDAVSDYWQLVVNAHMQLYGYKIEAYPDPKLVEVFAPMKAAYSQLTAARAKVFDDELRRLVHDFDVQVAVATSLDVKQAREGLQTCYQLLVQIEERVNALLRQLF